MYSSKAGVPWSGTALAAVAKVMAVTTAASRGPTTRFISSPTGPTPFAVYTFAQSDDADRRIVTTHPRPRAAPVPALTDSARLALNSSGAHPPAGPRSRGRCSARVQPVRPTRRHVARPADPTRSGLRGAEEDRGSYGRRGRTRDCRLRP